MNRAELIKQIEEIQRKIDLIDNHKRKTVFVSWIDKRNKRIVNEKQHCDLVDGYYHGIKVNRQTVNKSKPLTLCGTTNEYIISPDEFREDVLIASIERAIESYEKWIKVYDKNIKDLNETIKSIVKVQL